MKSNQNRKITHSTVYGMVIEKNGTNQWKNKWEKKKTGAGHERKKEDRLGHREERNESMKSKQNRKITHSTVYGMVNEKNGTNPWKNMWEKKENFYSPVRLWWPAFADCQPIAMLRETTGWLVWKPVLNSEGVRSVRKCRHLFDCLRWNCWTSFLVGVSDFFS